MSTRLDGAPLCLLELIVFLVRPSLGFALVK